MGKDMNEMIITILNDVRVFTTMIDLFMLSKANFNKNFNYD